MHYSSCPVLRVNTSPVNATTDIINGTGLVTCTHDITSQCAYSARKSVTVVKLSDDLGNDVWPRLKSFILPDAQDHILYMCANQRDRLPPWCVLNGLQTVPIPPQLAASRHTGRDRETEQLVK